MTGAMAMPRIRSAIRTDSAGIRGLVADILREFGFALESHTTDADLRDVEASYIARGGMFEVIELGAGEIVGCAGLYPLDVAPGAPRICELRKMYLRPSVRGKGLGRQLLERALAGARASGFHTVVLETASNLTDAIALYQHYGFIEYDAEHRTSRCDRTFRLELSHDSPAIDRGSK